MLHNIRNSYRTHRQTHQIDPDNQ